jgi:hypothetical protein
MIQDDKEAGVEAA